MSRERVEVAARMLGADRVQAFAAGEQRRPLAHDADEWELDRLEAFDAESNRPKVDPQEASE
jgi:hypothetical protein